MVGSEISQRDDQRLRDYLDRNAATMPHRAPLCRRTATTRFVIITSAAGTTERLEPELKSTASNRK